MKQTSKIKNEEMRVLLKKYFTTLVHYQYDINNDVEGAEKAFREEEHRLQDEIISTVKEHEKILKEKIKELEEKAWMYDQLIN